LGRKGGGHRPELGAETSQKGENPHLSPHWGDVHWKRVGKVTYFYVKKIQFKGEGHTLRGFSLFLLGGIAVWGSGRGG